ncbi:MAG TPA: hypothetical protein VLD59_02055 [Steroidobacteraceae bacterium]|nr:hypothetical protein [Steroidobacteraceae bacterium]
MRPHFPAFGLLMLVFVPWNAPQAQEEEPEFTDEFPLEDCHFSTVGGNPYFILKPRRQLYFTNARCVDSGECEDLEELWITVKPTVRKVRLEIDGRLRNVWTRVVQERETENAELKEISRNFFADCAPLHDVYYFGEEVDIYEDGEIVSHEGAWLAGRNGARPGIIMPDSGFILGQRYFQELAPGVALDRAEHVETGVEITVPAGTFEDCIEVTETTPFNPNEESTKVYCRDVGLVIDGDLELTAIFGDDHGNDRERD